MGSAAVTAPTAFPGHAYRYCSAYGTWEMALSLNKTWANYTECAVLFSSESRSREKVTLLVGGAGKGTGLGTRGMAGTGGSPEQALLLLCSRPGGRKGPGPWGRRGAEPFSSRRCLSACT